MEQQEGDNVLMLPRHICCCVCSRKAFPMVKKKNSHHNVILSPVFFLERQQCTSVAMRTDHGVSALLYLYADHRARFN